jgi:hypothetical protein
VTDRQAHEVKSHLDEARRASDLVMPCIWGALQGTATADRWDHAATHLEAALIALTAAQAALAAMDKQEPYCTACGEPVLSLMYDGWSHFSAAGLGVESRYAGHELELDWRPVGADGKGNDDAG